MNSRKEYLKDVKRIVIKVGTSTLTYSNGLLNLNRIENLVRQIVDIQNKGVEVILVTSAAIGAGMGKLRLENRPKSMPEKQAAAAVGQVVLMHIYQKIFSEYGKIVAQILLTREDMENEERAFNAKNTFEQLLSQGVIPIVNENDAITTEEIKIGDNDSLSAIVAILTKGDLLILLSDIDGLYDSNPKENKDAKLMHFIEEITDEVEAVVGGPGSAMGTGGMFTKIKAAKLTASKRIPMIIANGASPYVLNSILEGEIIGTLFNNDYIS